LLKLTCAGFEGSKCETPAKPTSKPDPGRSSGASNNVQWIIPVAVILALAIVAVVVVAVVKWRKSAGRTLASSALSNTTSFTNPMYNAQEGPQIKPVLENATYEEVRGKGEYAEVSDVSPTRLSISAPAQQINSHDDDLADPDPYRGAGSSEA
jgi:heme/copper-type cytochrome/quinol oxidase subunit 1